MWLWLRPAGAGCLPAHAVLSFRAPSDSLPRLQGASLWPRHLLLSPVKASLLSCLLQKLSGSACPTLLTFLCFVTLPSRFLHDKNSREFLYYRKKIAEIRKGAEKLQAVSQKGKWLEGSETNHAPHGNTVPRGCYGVGVVSAAPVCALLGSGGHVRSGEV